MFLFGLFEHLHWHTVTKVSGIR